MVTIFLTPIALKVLKMRICYRIFTSGLIVYNKKMTNGLRISLCGTWFCLYLQGSITVLALLATIFFLTKRILPAMFRKKKFAFKRWEVYYCVQIRLVVKLYVQWTSLPRKVGLGSFCEQGGPYVYSACRINTKT